MTNKLTDKLWKAMKRNDWSPGDLDTLITDFLQHHDEELKAEWLQEWKNTFWGIEKRREQAEKLKSPERIYFGTYYSSGAEIDAAFGLTPEDKEDSLCDSCKEVCKATHGRKECSLYSYKDPETHPEKLPHTVTREEVDFSDPETQSQGYMKKRGEKSDIPANVHSLNYNNYGVEEKPKANWVLMEETADLKDQIRLQNKRIGEIESQVCGAKKGHIDSLMKRVEALEDFCPICGGSKKKCHCHYIIRSGDK